jgi:hypothetical protein
MSFPTFFMLFLSQKHPFETFFPVGELFFVFLFVISRIFRNFVTFKREYKKWMKHR